MKLKPQKGYAVVWTDKARIEYGVPRHQIIVLVEPKEEIKINMSKTKIGRQKYLYADVFAIFETDKEAEAFRAGNADWKVQQVTLLVTLT
jgi:hypothetical protein